jgi:hypothetical protein
MADKKSRLMERATATARQPRPERLRETDSRQKGYRVVAVSLYTPEAEWIDYITQVLQRAGNPKANRSLVVREAISRLQEELHDKSPEDALHYFIERQVRRSTEELNLLSVIKS